MWVIILMKLYHVSVLSAINADLFRGIVFLLFLLFSSKRFFNATTCTFKIFVNDVFVGTGVLNSFFFSFS